MILWHHRLALNRPSSAALYRPTRLNAPRPGPWHYDHRPSPGLHFHLVVLMRRRAAACQEP
eukprot:325550-Hanusia_phi.AAC.2